MTTSITQIFLAKKFWDNISALSLSEKSFWGRRNKSTKEMAQTDGLGQMIPINRKKESKEQQKLLLTVKNSKQKTTISNNLLLKKFSRTFYCTSPPPKKKLKFI